MTENKPIGFLRDNLGDKSSKRLTSLVLLLLCSVLSWASDALSVTLEHQCVHPVWSRGFDPDRLSGGYIMVKISITSKGEVET